MRPTADNIRQGECDATVGAAGRHGRSIGSWQPTIESDNVFAPQRRPFRSRVILTETLEVRPSRTRSLTKMQSVRSLRKRQLIDSFKAKETDAVHRKGAYWGIRTNIKEYELGDPLDCPFERTLALAKS